MAWKPKPVGGLNWQSLDLNPQEGFLLSRADGNTSSQDLPHLTGLSPAEVATSLARLVALGALEPDPQAPPPAPPVPTAEFPAADSAGANDLEDRRYRKVFEERFHALPVEQRVAHAREPEGTALLPLCFDPSADVVVAVVEHMHMGLPHARLVAEHHRNAHGLDALLKRPELLRDAQVQRALLRNPQTQDALFNRMMAGKPLRDVFACVLSRDVAERSKARCRSLLRSRFTASSAEERVELILSSEGRVLTHLSGLALDGKTASLLCARTFSSIMLVQNLLRFPGLPPPVLVHLAKQPLVVRNPNLRTLVTQHPNAPAELKSRG